MTKYNFWIGLWKMVKNVCLVFAPAFLAFFASVPLEYTPIAGALAYLLKNYAENN